MQSTGTVQKRSQSPRRAGLLAAAALFVLGASANLAHAVEEVVVVASSTTTRTASADFTCDGVADDVQIQSAITLLPAGGGTIYLTDGTFVLANFVNLGTRTNIKIVGSGPGTILKIGNSISAIRGLGVKDITLTDFAIDGNQANNTAGKGLQFLDSTADGIKCERLYIYNTKEAAIGCTADRLTVTDCEIHDCAAGIQINSGSEKCTVIGSRIYTIGKLTGQLADAISCQGARCRFEANVVFDASDTGINLGSLTNEGRNTAIANEVFLNGNSGINTGGSDHCVIMGNVSYANGRKTTTPRSNAGIFLRDRTDGTQTSEDCIITGNRCFEDTADFPLPGGAVGQLYGLSVHRDTGASPANNIACGNDFRNNLTTNLFRDNVGAGNVFQDNVGDTVYNNGTATITSAATTVVVSHGLTSPPTAASIAVTPTSNLGSAAKFWVSNVTATQFTINLNVAPGSNQTFSWQAQVYVEPLH